MNEQTMAYFEYYRPKYSFQKRNYGWPMDFVSFKGIPSTILKPAGIAAPDMSVVVNYPENNITIWMTTLFD